MSAFGLDLKYAFEAIWKVLLVSVVLGAGLPAVYAVAIRSLAWGTGGSAEVDSSAAPNPAGKVIAAVLFLIVGYGVLSALLLIIASGKGMTIGFDHVIPWIEPKK